MPQQARPTSVTVFGILNIIFGAFGLLGLLMALGMQDEFTEPIMNAVNAHPFLGPWNTITTIIGGIVALILIATGIAMFGLNPWSRKACIIYSFYGIVMTVVNVIVVFAVMQPVMREATRGLGQIGDAAVAGGVIGAILGGILALGYAVVLLYFMTRPHVVEAFEMTRERVAEVFE